MNGMDSTTRRRLLALTGAGAATGLAGCFGNGGNGSGNGNGNGTPDPTELPPVHFLTDYNNEAWKARWEDSLIPSFQDETDIQMEIEYSGFSGSGQEGRLATLVQAGDPPALSTGTLDQVGDMFAGDQLAPTNDVVDEIRNNGGDFLSLPFQDFDGNYWQIPHGYYAGTFIYRTDVYEELGLEVPTTFAQLRENARIIDESDMDIRGYGVAGSKSGKSGDEFLTYLANAGAALARAKNPNADQPEAEIWLPEEESLAVIEHLNELSNYSPDPSSITWGSSIQGYLAGNFAQQYHLNAWVTGIAAASDITEIAENTGVAPLPLWEEGGITKDDSWLSDPTPDGHFVYRNSENQPGAREFMKWCYGDNMERLASMYSAEPTRFLPNYDQVLGSDAFQNISLFQENSYLLDQLEFIQETILGEYYNNVEESRINTPEPLYVARFFFLGEMMNQVLVTDAEPKAAYDQAYSQAQERMQEAKERFSDVRD